MANKCMIKCKIKEGVFCVKDKISLRKQPTFCDATGGFPAKLPRRNEPRNSIVMTCGSDMPSPWNF